MSMLAPHISIPAGTFVELVEDILDSGGSHVSAGDIGRRIEVAGAVDLAGRKFPRGLCIERFDFRGTVRMDASVFGNKVLLKDCTFDQTVDFTNTVLDNGIAFETCRFGIADVKLECATTILNGSNISGDVAFFQTDVHGCISAHRLHLAGNFTVAACSIRGASDIERAVLDLSNSRIVGDVNFELNPPLNVRSPSEALAIADRTAATGTPLLRRSIFVDTTGIRSVSLHNVTAAYVNLSYARFVGEVDLVHLDCAGVGSRVGYFACRPEEPPQWPADGEGFGGAEIEGDLVLSAGKFGLVHLNGIFISGSVMLVDGESGQIVIDDGLLGDTEVLVRGSDIGNFLMEGWHCSHFIKVHPTKIRGPENSSGLRGIHVRSSRVGGDLSFFPGIVIARQLQKYLAGPKGAPRPRFFVLDENSVLGAMDLDPGLRAFLNRWQRRLPVRGNINIEDCQVEGDVILTGVNVQDDRTADARIKIFDSRVTGVVRFNSPESYLAKLDVRSSPHEDPILLLLAQYIVICRALKQGDESAMFGGASCNAVETRGLSASGLDLTGLRLRRLDHTAELGTQCVQLHYAKIRGKIASFARLDTKSVRRIRDEIIDALPPPAPRADAEGQEVRAVVDLFPPPENRRRELLSACFGDAAIKATASIHDRNYALEPVDAAADIPGALDLQRAEVDELYISDASFCDCAQDCKAAEQGIVLDYAKIDKLYVARGTPRTPADPNDPGFTHNGFPVPVSLLDLSVRTWFLEAQENRPHGLIEQETTSADPYLDLLENDRIFRISSYLEIEKSLRNRGMESEATHISIAARYRDARTPERSVAPVKPVTGWFTRWRKWKWYIRLRQWKWRIWRPGYGRYRPQATLLPFLRLKRLTRPARENVASVLCLLLIIVVVILGIQIFVQPTLLKIDLMILLLLAAYLMRDAMRVFSDHLFWSLVNYGTSFHRLLIVIGVLAVPSLMLVSKDPRNFEPTLAAEAADAQKRLLASNVQSLTAADRHELLERKWDDDKTPKDKYWTFGERTWITLRHHVPLVAAVVSEEWQPADKPLYIRGFPALSGHTTAPPWWPFNTWPRSRDWFGLMLWLNWLLWPLFTPYVYRKLTRDE